MRLQNKKKTVLIVDDEEKIIEVIQSYLEKYGFEVFFAVNGKEALQIFNRHPINLVILDLMLPDISGEEICQRIRKISRVPIIMLTAKTEETDLLQGFHLGADDYLTKPFSPKELMARIDALLRRLSNEIQPLVNIISFNHEELVIDRSRHEVKKNGKIINLTTNEYKILMTLISYPKRMFSRQELITYAFGHDFDGYHRTIDAHIKNIRLKIETDPKHPRYIMTIYGSGYSFKGEED